jgi:hypothetical protein
MESSRLATRLEIEVPNTGDRPAKVLRNRPKSVHNVAVVQLRTVALQCFDFGRFLLLNAWYRVMNRGGRGEAGLSRSGEESALHGTRAIGLYLISRLDQ